MYRFLNLMTELYLKLLNSKNMAGEDVKVQGY